MPHTLRGQITASAAGTVKHLITDDGRYRNGLEVVDFAVWPEQGAVIDNFTGILGREFDMTADRADASDSRQFGWVIASEVGGASGNQNAVQYILDPFKVIVRDLFISIQSSSTQTYNYMVVLMPVELTPEEGLVQLIKERSQDDTR